MLRDLQTSEEQRGGSRPKKICHHAHGPCDRSLSLFSSDYLGLTLCQFWIPGKPRLPHLQRLREGLVPPLVLPQAVGRSRPLLSEVAGLSSDLLGQLGWPGPSSTS